MAGKHLATLGWETRKARGTRLLVVDSLYSSAFVEVWKDIYGWQPSRAIWETMSVMSEHSYADTITTQSIFDRRHTKPVF